MSENTSEQETTTVEPDDTATQEKNLSQADVDRIVARRLAQQKREHFADYDDLKAKATRLQEIEDASKSESQKLTDQIAALQQQLADKDAEVAKASLVSMKASVAAAKGVPAASLTGTTQEELEASADELIAWRDAAKPARKTPAPTGLKSGASTTGDSSANAMERAAAAMRALRNGG